jgi:HEXXH motif-containing protein
MTEPLRLSAADFDALATGSGSVRAWRVLHRAQLSRRLLLLRELTRTRLDGSDPHTARTIDLLSAAADAAPEAVRHLLLAPEIGGWLVDRIGGNGHHRDGSAATFAMIAAVAAMRAKTDTFLRFRPAEGVVWLPTIGVLHDVPRDRTVGLVVHGGAATIEAGAGPVQVGGDDPSADGRWWPHRQLTAVAAACPSEGFDIQIDDLSPYRTGFRMPLASRLSGDDVHRWQNTWTAAWTLLRRYLPQQSAEIAGNVRSLVPLAPDAGGAGLSATTRNMFGAFALTEPADPAGMVITFVHEMAHLRLNALLDFVPLYETSPARYRVPWRSDLRPIGGLLHGCYAFLAVAGAWHSLSPVVPVAEREYVRVRDQVATAMGSLRSAGELTPLGHRFVAGMTGTLQDMSARIGG